MPRFPEHWLRRTPVSAALVPVSWGFIAAAAARRALFRAGVLGIERLPRPVIVVGNLIVGGAGKTPLVLVLAERLAQAGYRPGIVCRGYGGTRRAAAPVSAADDPDLAGDEAVLLARRAACPVWAGSDRARAARLLLERHPGCDLIVSDDGLQHYRLGRDIEIAVEDGRGLGNGLRLPAGPLREAASRPVDALVVNGEPHRSRREALAAAANVYRMRLEPEAFHGVADPAARTDAASLRGRRVHAVAGIGDPQRFFALLSRMGIDATVHAFPDHHRFRAQELEFEACDALLMTEKDAVKCTRFARPHWYALRVRAELDASFFEFILTRLRELDDGRAAA